MEEKGQFNWVPFYHELADNLLQYKNNRQDLVKKVYQIYDDADIRMPTLEADGKLVDIDPFTVMGIFNKSAMSDDSRIKLLRAIASIFSITADVPTSFDGIPVLNQLNATFYYFIGYRGPNDIDELWDLFEYSLLYTKEQTDENQAYVSKYFDLVINKKGNGNAKVTMALYWIAPDTFLNLDSRNEWYIYESGKVPEAIIQTLPVIKGKISAAQYFEITDKVREYLQSDLSDLKDFKELSYEAWRYSEEVNKLKKEEKEKSQKQKATAALGDGDVRTKHYWLYSPGSNAEHWDEFYDAGIMAIGWEEVGNLGEFSSKSEITEKQKEVYDPDKNYTNSSYAMWQFVHDMQPGDVVFAKRGRQQVIGRGIVESGYEYDQSREYYKNVRQVEWTDKGEWEHPGPAAMKTLTDITSYTEYVDKLNALFESGTEDDVEEKEKVYPAYEKEDFLSEVYMDKSDYEVLVHLVETKKNVILQGAPGVGKTYAAKRLAYSMMGVKDTNRVAMVQFHQSYSYEDFIMGYRPTETGFELREGVFYNFCKKAEADNENKYFFIIDEINRGNLSKIFGEIFMLIESDKRDQSIQLLYADEKFSIPGNVYIIGTMNTADRSLAMLDYALRRRFAFFDMRPGFDTDAFKKYEEGLNDAKFDNLIKCIKDLNDVIAEDESLGEGFCIGHSYFCNLDETDDIDLILSSIVNYELIPLLKEYWFDDPESVQEWSEKLRSAIK